MHERRRLKRRHLIYYLRVFDRESGELLGHMVDLTTEGIMLLGESRLAPDRTYACRMVLPGDGEDSSEVLFDARVQWSRKDVNPDFCATGMHIENLDGVALETIEELIDEYGFRD